MPQMGAGLAQGGYHHYEKRISTEQKINRTVSGLILFYYTRFDANGENKSQQKSYADAVKDSLI